MRRSLLIALLLLAIAPAWASNAELAASGSPYLRQHADDPVHWRAWSPEALEEARREGKLVFISIGYASCHFCHRMARETFSNPDVAKVLDSTFVSILIDREERPDLDAWFGKIMVSIGGVPGWPMTLFISPDMVPLFGANFMPPHGDSSGPGFLDVASALAGDWRTDRETLTGNINALRPKLAGLAQDEAGPGKGDPRDVLVPKLTPGLDPLYGGFGTDSKFTQPAALTLLLHQAVRKNDAGLLEQVTRTLDHMAAGGIRDQLGGAFHRYASDRMWLMPHFEIDLADNALLARLYLEAFQATGRTTYKVVAKGVLDDLITRMRRTDGAFASALSAECGDSEGACYTWSAETIRAHLPDAGPFIDAYLPPGPGKKVLRLSPSVLDKALGTFSAERLKLLGVRSMPARDDKVLTDGNAMTAGALALGARVLGDGNYRRVAEDVVRQIDTLPLQHRKGGSEVFLDDYAHLIAAHLDLAEGGADPGHLDRARALAREMVSRFQTAPGRPLGFTPQGAGGPIPTQVLLREDGHPSGNAVALADLTRLSLFRGESDPAVSALAKSLLGAASVAPGLAAAWEYQSNAREIVIVGKEGDPGRAALVTAVIRRLLPGTVVAVLDPDKAADASWTMLAPRPLEGGKATAYVCHDLICDRPVNTVTALEQVLKQ